MRHRSLVWSGFQLTKVRDTQAQTLPTWQHVRAVYRQPQNRYTHATVGGGSLRTAPFSGTLQLVDGAEPGPPGDAAALGSPSGARSRRW